MSKEMPAVLKQFGDRVRELRQERQLSQEQFAAECGFDRTYISGIERGLRNVSLVNLDRLARCCGTNLSGLLKDL
jgi:transcriptional regulator with XRE-family HTH domain